MASMDRKVAAGALTGFLSGAAVWIAAGALTPPVSAKNMIAHHGVVTGFGLDSGMV